MLVGFVEVVEEFAIDIENAGYFIVREYGNNDLGAR
jgi:hypothetical protein